MRSYSAAARQRITEPWEECVLYPYDDKVPKRRIDGRLAYPEWTGGEIRGTITIGFGHTDAAGGLKIEPGMRLTRAQADALLSQDLAPCERAVNRLLEVDVSQHQFDAVVDTWFNCPKGATAAIKLINAGKTDEVAAKLLQYVCSKGERMQGLVNRRNAEIAWFNTPDDAEPEDSGVAAPHPDVVFCPKGERNPPPKTMAQSKTGTAAITIGWGAVSGILHELQATLDQAKAVKGQLVEFVGTEPIAALAHNPTALACAAVLGLAVFIWFDRRAKLVNDHV
jgi:lysozyme